MKFPLLVALIVPVAASAQIASMAPNAKAVVKVRNVAALELLPAALSRVRLLPSPFKRAMDADARYLLTVDPARLLAGYYANAGLPKAGPGYGGWETMGIAGHSLGHYLSACAMMYASTGDPRFRDKTKFIVQELTKCQANRQDGFVGGMPEADRVFGEIRRGEIRSKGFDLNGLWVPWYTQHKLLAGLIDTYLECKNPQSLTVATKLGDWAIEVTKGLTPELWQRMLACEHGGMNEAMANLYALTGERRYLDLALKFHHEAVLGPLERHEAKIAGLHGNTNIPKVIGCAREYELTGEPRFRNIAQFFWEQVVHDHTYAIGGHGMGEYFGPPGKLSDRLSANTCETCNTYNMLKLSQHLMLWKPSVELGDFYERATYNHILASQNHATGMMCYFVPLGMGSRKEFGDEFNTFTCCHGTGMENHAKYGESIFFTGSQRLLVNLYVPSTFDWAEQGVKVRLDTNYPQTGEVKISLEPVKPTAFAIDLRVPSWAGKSVQANINGKPFGSPAKPGTYLRLNRTWRQGDAVTLTLPLPIRTEAMPDNANRLAVFKGPVVLAGIWPKAEERAPVIVPENKPVPQWLRPQGNLVFRSSEVVKPVDLKFMPFYEVQSERYSVYFDRFDAQQWAQRQAEYRAEEDRRKELERRTVDLLGIGEMQPERDHNLTGEKTSVGEFGGRKWRHAWDGGWFAFDLKVDGNVANQLILTYWGGDGGNREFDILVDGVLIATEKLKAKNPPSFIDVPYEIPRALTDGKSKVTVRLQAKPNQTAGGLFGARMIRP